VAFPLITSSAALDSQYSAAKEQKVSNKMNVRERQNFVVDVTIIMYPGTYS